MQWDGSPNAGFTSGTPWIKVNPNYRDVNTEDAQKDPGSVYHYYRKLIKLRKTHEIIVYGRYELLLETHPELFVYKRTLNGDTLLVICNFYGNETEFEWPDHLPNSSAELLITNYENNQSAELGTINLAPYETRVYLIKSSC
jgi:oligo-1,6-glucosidase